MSPTEKAQKALREGVSRFMELAQENAKIQLDGSLKSLILVSAVLQQYHAWYERGKAANDPEHTRFAENMAFLATCYVGDVLTRQFKGQWTTAANGVLAVTVAGKQYPLASLMADEIQSGKPHSLLIVSQIDAALKAEGPKTETIIDEQLAPKMRSLAQAAAKDVGSMLKIELDFTPASLAVVDKALQRVKALIEMAPEHARQMTSASADKYGAYLGEVLLKETSGKWVYVKQGEQTYKAVDFANSFAMVELIVRAILEGKSLHMGHKPAATTMLEFYQACRRKEADAKLRRELTPQYALDNLDMLSKAAVEAAVSFGQALDGTLFSLSGLDEVISQKRAQLKAEAESGPQEAVNERMALTAISLGVYLGETLRRAHGGTWEKQSTDPEGAAPQIRHRKYLLFPINACAALLRGEAVQTGSGGVRTVQQYYQEVRPMLQDEMTKRLLGSAPDWNALVASLGPDQEFNRAVLDFAESCVLESRGQYGVLLDFSPESLRTVDEILKKIKEIPEEKKKGEPHYDPLNLIWWYGSYSGEVFRRVLGGSWSKTPINNPPQDVPRLEIEGAQIFVLNKIKKALTDPLGDSIAFMLSATKKILEEQRTKAASAGAVRQDQTAR